MNSVRQVATAVAILAYALTASANGSWVLCLGGDGHITVEPDAARCCWNVTATQARTSTSGWRLESPNVPGCTVPSYTAPGCGPCTDIPLLFGSTDPIARETTPAGAGAQKLYSQPSVHCPAVNAAAASLASLHGALTARGGGALARLRTFVLRC